MLNNIDLKKFSSPSYIFDKTPPSNSEYLYLVLLFGLMILLAILAWFGYSRLKKKLPPFAKIQTRVFNLFFYLGMTGLFLLFFRWQGIAYLGSRFFMLVLLFIFIIWGLYLIYFRLRIFPKEMAKFEQKQKFEKYLPRTK